MDHREPGDVRVAAHRFVISAVLSLAILAGGMAWTWSVGQRNNRIAHQLGHLKHAIDGGAVDATGPGTER